MGASINARILSGLPSSFGIHPPHKPFGTNIETLLQNIQIFLGYYYYFHLNQFLSNNSILMLSHKCGVGRHLGEMGTGHLLLGRSMSALGPPGSSSTQIPNSTITNSLDGQWSTFCTSPSIHLNGCSTFTQSSVFFSVMPRQFRVLSCLPRAISRASQC